MKLISTNTDLSRQLIRLMTKYPKIAIATAWASANTDAFKTLLQHKNKIDLAVIGTHFYQTHPDVLDQFVGSSKVKFVLQPHGVFHPKVYLFWSEQAWEVVIGSANLTAGALTKNSELSVLITSEDGRPEMRGEISTIISDYWSKAGTITAKEADNYRRIWKLKSRDLNRLSDFYGKKEATKPAVKSKVMSMSWASYVAEVKKDTNHGFDQRLEMLSAVKAQFDQYQHFNDIPLDARRGIAGLASKTIPHWAWFGKMSVARTYAPLIKQEHRAFSLALDEIPQLGDVRKEHFDRYIREYLKAFPNGGAGLAHLVIHKSAEAGIFVAPASL